MMRKCLLLLLLLLGACRSEPQPAPLPATDLPATDLPATDPPATATFMATETAVAPAVSPATETPASTPTPSPLPTRTPTPLPPPAATAAPVQEEVTIDLPLAADVAVAGQPFTFTGQVVPVISTTLTLQVLVAHQPIITEPVPFDTQNGSWSLTQELPAVAGPAEVVVTGAGATAAVDFQIAPPLDMPGPYVTLSQPAIGQTAAAGYTLHFSGAAQDLVDSRLTMAVLAEECTTTVAAFSFTLTGGDWTGELILPPSAPPGLACAIAYTGTRDSDTWHEMRVPLLIVAADDERARYIQVGNPPGLTFTAGETTVVYGVAAGAPDGQVQVSLTLGSEEESGTVLAASPAAVNAFGYWEAELTLPADQTGPALLLVAMGSDEAYTEVRTETAVAP